MKTSLNSLLLEYADMFNDNFPIMAFKATAEDEIIKLIKDCIDNNKPYNIKYDKGKEY